MYYFTCSSGFFYLFRGGAGFPYRERAGELDLHRSTGLLPDDMMQNRRTVMSNIISRRMDRCERRRRKLGDADIIKPNHRDVVRYSVSVFRKCLDRTHGDRIAGCKNRRRKRFASDQITGHLIAGINSE